MGGAYVIGETMHTWAGSALTGSVKHLTTPTCSGKKDIQRPRTMYLAADTSVYPEAYRPV